MGKRRNRLPIQSILVGVILNIFSSAIFADQDYTLVAVEAGYRVDQLDWNIGGDNIGRTNEYVNVLSELTWTDLDIRQISFQFDSVEKNRMHVRMRLSFGQIIDGKNQDSDYDYNDRQGEFSRSNNNAGGDVRDIVLGLGYLALDKQYDKFSFYVTPMLGFSFHQQNLEMKDGYTTLAVPTPGGPPDPSQVGPLVGLDSSYDTNWETFWLGTDIGFRHSQKLDWIISLMFHSGKYKARANWNLRADFAHPLSFEHTADGYGIGTSIGGRYLLTANLFLSFGVNYQQWRTEPGVDRVYFSAGGSTDTPLNEVNWESVAFNLGFVWRLSH